MPDKNSPKKPVENHKTAAWANMETVDDEKSKIFHPDISQVVNAKEYVDGNEK
ncbi:MAG: CDIF630_02480 family spore surface protein [Bacillota bacterium]|jgi:hypothetical protein